MQAREMPPLPEKDFAGKPAIQWRYLMNPDDLAYQLHEDGDCDPRECPYCSPEARADSAMDDIGMGVPDVFDDEAFDVS